MPTPLHLRSLNAGDISRTISLTDGRWMQTVPGRRNESCSREAGAVLSPALHAP